MCQTRTPEWIPLAEAARRLDCTHGVIKRLIEREQLSVRRIPGTHPRVEHPELARLVNDNTRPALAS